MRIRATLFVCAAPLLVASCTQTSSPNAGQLTEQGKSMEAMLADINQIRAFTYGSGDQRTAETAASDLVAWSNRMAELFPPGQASQDYVDMSPERVRNAPIAMQNTAKLLLAAVHSGNRAAAGERLAQTEQDGCGACHRNRSR